MEDALGKKMLQLKAQTEELKEIHKELDDQKARLLAKAEKAQEKKDASSI